MLTQYVHGTYMIFGTLTITASDEFTASASIVAISALWNGVPSVTKTDHIKSVANTVSQVRCSTDTSGYLVAVDIYVPNNFNQRTISLQFEGIGVLLASPTSGATALPSQSTVLAL